MERKEEIKKELRNMGNPFSERARYLKSELKMLNEIDDFYSNQD